MGRSCLLMAQEYHSRVQMAKARHLLHSAQSFSSPGRMSQAEEEDTKQQANGSSHTETSHQDDTGQLACDTHGKRHAVERLMFLSVRRSSSVRRMTASKSGFFHPYISKQAVDKDRIQPEARNPPGKVDDVSFHAVPLPVAKQRRPRKMASLRGPCHGDAIRGVFRRRHVPSLRGPHSSTHRNSVISQSPHHPR